MEQYKRYFATSKETGEGPGEQTREDTRDAEEEREDHRALVREDHRHHDEKAQALLPSTAFPSRSPHGEKAVRRRNTTLAVCRARVIEPLGDLREAFYEQRLLLGLPWYCPDLKPAAENDPGGKAHYTWRFLSVPPAELHAEVAPVELHLGYHLPVSMEMKCHELDRLYSNSFACLCCAKELPSVCANCVHAIGFHRCVNPDGDASLRWRNGTLHGGRMDVERMLYRLT